MGTPLARDSAGSAHDGDEMQQERRHSAGCARQASAARQKSGVLPLLLVIAMAAHAEPPDRFEPTERIERAATALIEAQPRPADTRLEVTVDALDRRLRLPRCAQAPSASLPPGARAMGRTAVRIECGAGASWRLYVPVRARVLAPVVVAKRDLGRSRVLAGADVELIEKDLGRLPAGYVRDPADLVGRRLRGPVRAGTVLAPRLTAAVPVVRAGEEVALRAGSGGIAVRTTAIALTDGHAGDRIRVRNGKTRSILQGTVRADGVVEAGP